MRSAVNEPKVKEKLLQLGLEPGGSTPDEFSKFVRQEMTRVGSLVKSRNIKVD
jgi:tripartite-type tricarboxylate transporter receptor subunit TctC